LKDTFDDFQELPQPSTHPPFSTLQLP